MKVIGILILVVFYAIFISKMILQRRKGIKTNQVAKGKKKDKTFYIESVLKVTIYSIVLVEVISIFTSDFALPISLIIIGIMLGVIGNAILTISIITMKDSWRAGLAEDDKTEIITTGIYQISRNPAFFGFNLVYISILILFFNPVLLFFTIFAMVMLHIQILQEERYLSIVFGKVYLDYKSHVYRYLGKKK